MYKPVFWHLLQLRSSATDEQLLSDGDDKQCAEQFHLSEKIKIKTAMCSIPMNKQKNFFLLLSLLVWRNLYKKNNLQQQIKLTSLDGSID